ncbi:ribosomal-processing cysteine protease Prp [Clostridium fermenticellae]|uniref:Ribosomal processing cysteine protease Prp n=1 Tax=Clostridium fermenticellae TaxID=2068654 RepID=A0A386H642_9CLOT|nr:ribosomal-processing cysteine protease Prp [Clostridium fermenticellae]AYD41013.1 ribosomal-processing cysteine protease Prp [Clostridium fermenticellae]
MVNVEFVKKSGNFVSARLKGHAESTNQEFDMVCSAVSVISQTILIGMLEVLKVNAEYTIDNGFLDFSIERLSDENIEECQVLIKTMLLGLKNLEISYGDYIKIGVKEVW